MFFLISCTKMSFIAMLILLDTLVATEAVGELSSSFGQRLKHSRRKKERFRRSFFPARLYNASLSLRDLKYAWCICMCTCVYVGMRCVCIYTMPYKASSILRMQKKLYLLFSLDRVLVFLQRHWLFPFFVCCSNTHIFRGGINEVSSFFSCSSFIFSST